MNVRVEGGIVVVTPRGWLVGGRETEQLKEVVCGFLAEGNRRLVVDLSEVVMANSLAVGAFVGCWQQYRDRAGRVVLCGLNRRLGGIFRVTRLAQVFEVHETLADALAALEQVA